MSLGSTTGLEDGASVLPGIAEVSTWSAVDAATSRMLGERLTGASKEVAFGRVLGARDRGVVRHGRLRVVTQSTEQVCPDGMEQVEAIDVELVDQGERGTRPFDLGHGHGAVERNDGART